MALRVCAPRASSNTVARVRGVTPDRGAEVPVGFEHPASTALTVVPSLPTGPNLVLSLTYYAKNSRDQLPVYF